MSSHVSPALLVTTGEPAGIGPDLVIKLAQQDHHFNITVIGDPDLLVERAEQLGCPLELVELTDSTIPHASSTKGTLNVIPLQLNATAKCGELNVQNADYIIEMLNRSCDLCLNQQFDALVTGPLQKSIINDAGIEFSGHTEYLANRCGDCFPVMLLACPGLRVALVTTHLPLRDVPAVITKDRIETVLRIVSHDLEGRFGITSPVITVCGLNPHAGENGHLGSEENEIISPVIELLRESGYRINGPVPADTAFRQEIREQTDAFVCMYHDQGLPVLKTLGFGEAVNITLGLPIIRTSVDHGTALSLAGTGKADCSSLVAAIEIAEKMVIHSYQQSKQTGSQTALT